MRLYPTLSAPRRATIAGDVAVVLLLLVFAWLGKVVHDNVAGLRSLGQGVRDAGVAVERSGADAAGGVRRGLEGAADAVGGAPVVGGSVAGALRKGGQQASGAVTGPSRTAGRQVAAAGTQGEQAALDTARVLGWVTFLVPSLLLLSRAVPPRVRQVRTLSAAERVFRGADEDPERLEALAQRAAFGLPYTTLLRHSRDPLGDLLAGRLEPLLAAIGEDAGLRAPATEPPGAIRAPS